MPLPPAMPARVDLGELKFKLAKRLGPERARRYFSYLHRLLSQKLSKAEFDKLCFITLGRENLSLHNQLIQSVIKNAFQAKRPPPQRKILQREEVLKSVRPPVWFNGNILPKSPRKQRSGTQKSKLGPIERADVAVKENGDLCCHDFKERQESQDSEQPFKCGQINSNGIQHLVVGEDQGFTEKDGYLNLSQHPLHAPLGIPFFPASVGLTKRFLSRRGSSSTESFISYIDSGELCHTEDLRKRMERIVKTHSLGGVTLDCADLLNNGLNAHLKRLIKSSMELAQARLGNENLEHQIQKQKAHGMPIKGIQLGNPEHVHNDGHMDLKEKSSCLITLQDFTLAMRLNSWQTGEDAPVVLEKCLRSFGE
ncbi:hypothetical protein HPP92_017748 [Vanilla planifolia]|uniref:Uncharacterized protein n=1 Tax=Vanilla planifolia TaxID=51239 RepID=A0A835QCZ5_VANPL|nr:hypothetical protein HPP92_018368 [Vanilla planifolia]KAG0468420.1 hypothetical protein HPP92_017748 [Vanilla planifolia]